MEPQDNEDGADIQEFLNGFDYYEEDEEEGRVIQTENSNNSYDRKTVTSTFVRSGCYAALEEICVSELLSLLSSLFYEIAPLSNQSTGVDSDLSVWITHW